MPRTSRRKNGNGDAPLFRPAFDDVEKQSLAEFTEKAYLDYSMYVILDRALPHVGDGLKPVQRRIIYAMSELGLSARPSTRNRRARSATCIGKYPPARRLACYEAMVLMAQPFSYRYPLVDGQGNWGSPDDPKSFAAMRYTESRLTRLRRSAARRARAGHRRLGAELRRHAGGAEALPARLPNVLLNGATGIAVGMATDIPPHNLREVVAACIQLLDDPDDVGRELCTKHVRGPDFPTGREIITAALRDRAKIYETGAGSVRARATWEMEDGEIVITALPYQVSGSKVHRADRGPDAAKKLPMVEDMRDESDHENPTRLVITPRSNRVDIEG